MPQLDIGVDLGTASVVIYGKGSGIVLDQPAVIAIDRSSRSILAVGEEARRMLGRTPGNIVAMRPLQNGTVADLNLTCLMLNTFVKKVTSRRLRLFGGPRIILSLPEGVNEVERRSITGALFEAGARRTQLMERPIASAIGANLKIKDATGSMIVDVGGGLTEIAVISMGRCIVRESCPFAGDQFDEAIIRYIRRKHNLLIGELTAEDLKINIGSALERTDQLYMEVTGRNLISGLPKVMRIYSDEITEALQDPLDKLIEALHGVLEQTPAELASDIFDRGVTLTGGGGQLALLPEAIGRSLDVECYLAENPHETVARGCGQTLEHWNEFGQFIGNRRR